MSARWGRVAFAAYLALLGAGALLPMPTPPAPSPAVEPAEVIGWSADAIRNVLLFVPLGAALVAWRGGLGRALLAGFALSLAIELLQLMIPGRNPSLLDLAANTLGTSLGAFACLQRGRWPTPSPPDTSRLALAAWLLALAAPAATAVLLRPALPESIWLGGWTLELAQLERYEGRVLEAHVGQSAISPFGPVADSAALRAALQRGEPIVVRGIAGPAPDGLAPLVTIHDVEQRDVLLVGVDGVDLVVRVRNLASVIGLERPALRAPAALQTLRPGAPLHVRIVGGQSPSRVEVAGAASQAVGWTPGRAWALVLPGVEAWHRTASVIDAVCLALLVLPAGRLTRRRMHVLVGAGVLALWLCLLPLLGPMMRPPPHEWIGLAAGVLLGRWMPPVSRLRRRSRTLGPRPRSSPPAPEGAPTLAGRPRDAG